MLKDDSVVLISEHKDETNDLYMYMVMNAYDPDYQKDENVSTNVELTFDSSYKCVLVYNRGNLYIVSLGNGKYKTSLDAGYADYIIPFKAV